MQVFGVLVLPALPTRRAERRHGCYSELLCWVRAGHWLSVRGCAAMAYLRESRLMPKANFSGEPGGSAFERRVDPARALLRPARTTAGRDTRFQSLVCPPHRAVSAIAAAGAKRASAGPSKARE